MKNIYFKLIYAKFHYFVLIMSIGIGNVFTADAQVYKPASQRTSSYTPNKKIYNIQGDFTIIGNTNLTLESYGDDTTNANPMVYVDVDNDPKTLNSSSSTLALSNENGALNECSKIIFAGLYWTGRASDSIPSKNTFTVTKGNITKNYDKTKISLKASGQSSYTTFTANPDDIYYPTTSQGYMYAAYAEVTDYVRANGVGEYFAADIALIEGDGGDTGFYGGWSLIVVYENSKMKYRDVTIFDGYAYVAGSVTANFELPVSGFNTVQAGPVAMKLGLVSGEGDRGIGGDFFKIKKQSDNTFMSLNHSGNTASNFFNSSINTGGNTRNPNLLNNTGLDISMFNIPNSNNEVITNNQTSTTFNFATTQDTYIIFAIAMAVDAYIPVVEDIIVGNSINGIAVSGPITSVLPGDEIDFKINIYNKGTEAVNNTKHIIPIPYMVDYVPGSLTKNLNFSPLPSPNNYYFDPSLGLKGSIVYDFGTLPLPANPDTILADFSFKVKVTTNCSILKNSGCGYSFSLSGTISGKGAVTEVEFKNKPFVVGHKSDGLCTGEPILDPLTIRVNATAYVNQNCQSTPAMRDFAFCNPNSTIPISDINAEFHPGSRFYNLSGTTEYTVNNPFPATAGAVQYFALPSDATVGCNFPFTITVNKVVTKPATAGIISYCRGAAALPLTATATVHSPPYKLYYFTSEAGTPQLSITPSTANVGSTTYWVAEAASGNCIGPKVPIVVIVNALPSHPTTTLIQPTCAIATGSIIVTAPIGVGITYSIDGSNYSNTTGIFSGLAAGTYLVNSKSAEGCTCSPSIVTIKPQPSKPAEPAKINCWDTFTFNTETCLWVNNNTPKPVEPIKVNNCDIYTFNTTTCLWDITRTQPVKPAVLCYQTATFNTTTCVWNVTGIQPVKPELACYQTATFNTTNCVWDVTGSQPVKPALACYESAAFNTTTCVWDVAGMQPVKPALACYESATFNTTTCVWDVTGTQPVKPTILCYESATFNTTTCVWNLTGMQPVKPELACYQTATFNTTNCVWDVTGSQPVKPAMACYESAAFNTTTCVWDVTGMQPVKPALACYESATFNTTTCVWDVTGTQPVKPTILCYESATFNTTTCVWVVTGTQPVKRALACYETATFNTTTCVWNIMGSQPVKPALACYETAAFNTTTCVWDVTGMQPVKPALACYQSATFNTTTCVWNVTGTQPVKPELANYQIATWNLETCVWDVTGTPPVLVAQDDTIAGGNGATGNANAGTILNNNGKGNDTLNGVNLIIAQLNLTVTTTAIPIGGAPVPSINTTTGLITVPAGTPAGIYTIIYQICEKANPTNCDSATVTITVTAAIIANDDNFIDVDGTTGNPNVGNVLNNNGNDTLNGINVSINQVNITVTTPATSIGGAPVPALNTITGQISVLVGTAAGTYTIVYQICEKLNPTNCDSAIVTVNVGEVLGANCEAVVIHKALTPNNDGINDLLVIDGAENNICYPSGISVEIYNRWGVLVFETSKYSNTDNYFDGYSKGRTTISKSEGLPTGTYFYILNYESSDGKGNIQINKKEGFIYLSR